MSTFDGFVPEFPNIRVDFFRRRPELPPALACFLSHVHSDHLAGLDTFDGSFIYCSAATKAIVLRLEKSAVRLNYARGILDNPQLQTYRHLEKKLRPIPLDTPTTIDLAPGLSIRVTLLDANHCVGAVMFLFEDEKNAVLYTGDIRCEPRFVTAITQNPNMIEYSSGFKTLDRIYLDTSVLEDYPLQTKGQGLQELLEKLRAYPEDTIFHFQAWTYGYEEVWIALSKALNSKIHVDDYKMRVFESLVTKSKDNRWASRTHLAKEAPALVGFTCGNHHHEGCLTRDEDVRIHSCEKGMGCSVMETKPIVWIRPIVTHLKDGQDVMEVGIGGGGEDLTQTTTLTSEDISEILQLMSARESVSKEVQNYIQMIKKALASGRDMTIIDGPDVSDEDTAPRIIRALFQKLEAMLDPIKQEEEAASVAHSLLPNVIRFPYARHSSLPELRVFVGALRPKDVVPCTFDAERWLEKGWTIEGLFGDLCSGTEFQYDEILDRRAEEIFAMRPDTSSPTKCSQQSAGFPTGGPDLASEVHVDADDMNPTPTRSVPAGIEEQTRHKSVSPTDLEPNAATKRKFEDDFSQYSDISESGKGFELDSQQSALSEHAYETRRNAFKIARSNLTGESWGIIGLISTTDNHAYVEEELGKI